MNAMLAQAVEGCQVDPEGVWTPVTAAWFASAAVKGDLCIDTVAVVKFISTIIIITENV